MAEQSATETQAVEEQGQEPAGQTSRGTQNVSLDQASAEEHSTPQTVEELPAWAQKIVKDLRAENAKTRKEIQKREDKEKTELQKLAEERDALRGTLDKVTSQLRRSAFIEQINLPNARWAWAAASDLGIEVEFDEDNRPTNLDAVRKELKKADPNLFGTGSADAGQTSRVQQPNGDPKAAFLAQQLLGE